MANNPYVNKVQYGNQTLLDLTSDNIVANKLASGKTAHDKSGNQITGTYDFATATAANAIADDVTEGKTGWANGVQIIGTKKGIPTWADGTDEEIAEALTRHYNDEIDLNDYWTVGDERVVHLSAMSATNGLTDTHASQDVVFILLNQGGAELKTPINGHNECAFIVGQKDCLLEVGRLFNGSNVNGWEGQSRYAWCIDGAYPGAIPSTFKTIFKDHYYYVVQNKNSTSSKKINSIFRLPSLREIGIQGSNDITNDSYKTLDYYKMSSNRLKSLGKDNTNKNTYWTISKYFNTGSTNGNLFYMVNTSGSSGTTAVATNIGLAPQGVI